MRILDMDMDFFLNRIAFMIAFSNQRLSNSYLPWEEKSVREFLEVNCGLRKSKKIKGRVIKHHEEAFYFWRELIIGSQLEVPFNVVHIDSHADLGLGDYSWEFISEHVLKLPLKERMWVEKYKSSDEFEQLSSGNYLLYAIACEWIESLTYVTHPSSAGDDFILYTMKGFDVNSGYLQLKNFKEPIPCEWEGEISEQEFVGQPQVAFNIVKDYRSYIELSDFDYFVFSQSPSYTPQSADFIIDIIKNYIEEI